MLRTMNYISRKVEEMNLDVSVSFKNYPAAYDTTAEYVREENHIYLNSCLLDEDPDEFLDTSEGVSFIIAAVDSILAHEVGHYLDPKLDSIQDMISSIYKKDGLTQECVELIILRERNAYELGKVYASYLDIYDDINQSNLDVYYSKLEELKGGAVA